MWQEREELYWGWCSGFILDLSPTQWTYHTTPFAAYLYPLYIFHPHFYYYILLPITNPSLNYTVFPPIAPPTESFSDTSLVHFNLFFKIKLFLKHNRKSVIPDKYKSCTICSRSQQLDTNIQTLNNNGLRVNHINQTTALTLRESRPQ